MTRKPLQGSTRKLIAAAIACERANRGQANPALVALQERGTRAVLDAAVALCRSKDPMRRFTGATILGELGNGSKPNRTFPEECCDALLALLRSESDPVVFVRAIERLGHLGNRRADRELIPLAAHTDDDVRIAVAFALNGATSDDAVQTLLGLMNDSSELARDWATTAIGQETRIDGPEIRSALLERVKDPDEITRAEALGGLARRGDKRVVPHLLANLENERDRPYLFEDAARLYLGLNDDKAEAQGLIVRLRQSGANPS